MAVSTISCHYGFTLSNYTANQYSSSSSNILSNCL